MRWPRHLEKPARGAILALAVAGGCGGGGQEEADLHARLSVAEREVEALREVAERLESGGAALPEGDVIVALEESLVKDLLEAQLPFEARVDQYRLWLDQAEVSFNGSPGLTLVGGIALEEQPRLSGEVRVIGALDDIVVDRETGVLQAAIAVDHLDLIKVAGVEGFLGGGALNTLAQTIRHQLDGRLPGITIPVKIEQDIELPSVTDGPVRIRGATLPLEVGVSQVLAGQGRLWVAVHVAPGEIVKTPLPSAGESGRPR